MSEVKVGDRGKVAGSSHEVEVTAIDRFNCLLIRFEDGSHLSFHADAFTPCLAFFEVGKTYQYRRNGAWRFTCDYVGEADGKYAVGPGAFGVVYVLRFIDFDNWEEI